MGGKKRRRWIERSIDKIRDCQNNAPLVESKRNPPLEPRSSSSQTCSIKRSRETKHKTHQSSRLINTILLLLSNSYPNNRRNNFVKDNGAGLINPTPNNPIVTIASWMTNDLETRNSAMIASEKKRKRKRYVRFHRRTNHVLQ